MATTLKASTAAIRAYLEKQKRMAGAAAASPPPEVRDKLERVRQARERLEAQQAPHLKRQVPAVRESSGMQIAPTPEAVAKGAALHPIYNAKGVQEARVYRTKGPVERYAEAWPHDCYSAFQAYILDAHAADGPSLVIDLNRSGGGGTHLGGLGNVHQRTRDAYERFHWVRDRMTQGSVQILDWLVLEVKREASGKGWSDSEVGTRIFPAFRDKATAKGVAIGRLLGAGEELAAKYRMFRVISADEARPEMKVIGERWDE